MTDPEIVQRQAESLAVDGSSALPSETDAIAAPKSANAKTAKSKAAKQSVHKEKPVKARNIKTKTVKSAAANSKSAKMGKPGQTGDVVYLLTNMIRAGIFPTYQEPPGSIF